MVVCRNACMPTRRLKELVSGGIIESEASMVGTVSGGIVESEASMVGTWSGTVVGLLASASAVSLSILLAICMTKRCSSSLKGLRETSLAMELVRCDRIVPEVEDDVCESPL